MKTFYVVQMSDGRYLDAGTEIDYFQYCTAFNDAAFFNSEEGAIRFAPYNQPFTVIKFYDK